MAQGLVQGLAFRVWGLGFRVLGCKFMTEVVQAYVQERSKGKEDTYTASACHAPMPCQRLRRPPCTS